MARIRTIKPDFWQDERIGSLSWGARLAFIAAWNLADDEGLLKWNAMYIKAQAFPYDDISKEQVENILGELSEQGMIVPYQDTKRQNYGWITNFRKHQRIDKPQKSKQPLPSIQDDNIVAAYAYRDDWTCQICGEPIHASASYSGWALSLDHVNHRITNGLDAPSNIRIAHYGCQNSENVCRHSGTLHDHSENVPGTDQDGSKTEVEVEREMEGEMEGKGKTVRQSDKSDRPDLTTIFDYWCQVMGKTQRTKFTKDRKTKIQARLREGYTVEDIKTAIDQCAASEFHQGKNDQGTLYNDLTLICRSGSQLEFFMDRVAQKAPSTGREPETLDQFKERNQKQAERVMNSGLLDDLPNERGN